jgi:molybdopterin synthase catalytic subunit
MLPQTAGVHEKNTITLTDIIERTKRSKNYLKTGAITIFIGTVRNQTDNRQVSKLELQAYEEQANKTLHAICKTLRKREGITDVQIHHLTGEFEPGEELVYVLVAGTHRNHVFPVLQEAVERYKKETPIFKKEHTTDKRGKSQALWTSEKEPHEG